MFNRTPYEIVFYFLRFVFVFVIQVEFMYFIQTVYFCINNSAYWSSPFTLFDALLVFILSFYYSKNEQVSIYI